MYCLDCGNGLETINYAESCTQWLCKNCNAYWYQSRTVRVEWSKKNIPLESDNGGINAPTTGTNKSWYEQAQELHQSLLKQDKVIDGYRKQNKQMKKLIQEIDNLIGDWEWHYCHEGTPQKAVYNLIREFEA